MTIKPSCNKLSIGSLLLCSSFTLVACGGADNSTGGQNGISPSTQVVANASAGTYPSSSLTPKKRNQRELEVDTLMMEAALLAEKSGDHHAAATHWGSIFDANKSNRVASLRFARQLRYIGAASEAERVLRETQQYYPNDPELQLEMSKAMLASGRASQAVPILEKFYSAGNSNAAVPLAIAYDRVGRTDEAQKIYAHQIKSPNPSAMVLNNAGLSYAMSGDLETAEKVLRRALVAPGVSAQTRQNLALVLGLMGKSSESAQFAAQVNQPEIAKASVDYYKSIVDQSDVWGQN